MRGRRGERLVRGLAAAFLLLCALPASAGRDIMLVLDNSGSMQANDPAKLASPAVLEFIQGQPSDTRVGIVVFSTTAALVMPLTPTEYAADGRAQEVLEKHFSYRGRWTQIAAGVERGLYELRNEGRADAQRAIVLMTDGIIDTGDARKDAELREWLRKDLAREATVESIKVFGVAFTERADFQLLQSISAATGGEYFRVLQAEGIARAFRRIDTVLAEATTPAQPEPAPAPAVTQAPAEAAQPETAAAEPAGAPGESQSNWLWWLLIAVALVAIAAGLGLAFRKARGATRARAPLEDDAQQDHGPKAVLFNNNERYDLGAQTVIIGRAGGNDPTRMYIIVPEKTVGRWHATIERRGQTFWVRDEGSVNGTFINDERVIGEQPLKHRDTLRVHNHSFEFEIPDLGDAERTRLSPRPRLVS